MHHTPLTDEMINDCPAVDIHAHAQGTVTPQTAWELGIRNKLITIYKNADGAYHFRDGPSSIGAGDPVELYSNIFCAKGGFPLQLDDKGHPIDIDYNYNCVGGGIDKFTGFDAVMATVQGHRHPPGGIQTPADYNFAMERYLESCVKQNIRYTEILQNIHIAHILYPSNKSLSEEEARQKFFRLCQTIVDKFARKGVYLRFQHCPNKTAAAGHKGLLKERSKAWPKWLCEAEEITPGVFVGLNSAGHEKMEKAAGGPEALKYAYDQAVANGFGAEAHAGEGIGVEHMLKNIRILPITRVAHGVQVIESEPAIDEVREKGITLVVMPSINIALGTPLHVKKGVPHPKLKADGSRDPHVVTEHIKEINAHPIFPLLRKHKLKIALATDNPGMGGQPYKDQVRKLAGKTFKFPPGFAPLSAEELAIVNLNAIEAAFCNPRIKQQLIKDLQGWMTFHALNVEHPLLPGRLPADTRNERQK